MTNSQVTIVGAGPGYSGWITRAGLQAIADAEVLLIDALVSPALLADIRWDAEVIDVGKRGGKPSVPQAQICERLVALAQKNKTVVRVKGGDPSTFGRLSEELDALRAAGISYQVIPGISAFNAAAASGGFSLTDRDVAASLTLLTGHRRAAGPKPEMDWQAASRSGTGAVYMGSLNAAENAQRLMDQGVPPATPVLVAKSISTAGQRMVQATLDTLADTMAKENLKPPVLWVYGDVTAKISNNFAKPRGNVALFRPYGQHLDWQPEFIRAGWELCAYPLHRIEPNSSAAKQIANSPWQTIGWVLISSRHGVDSLIGACGGDFDLREIGSTQFAVVGPVTAEYLKRFGLRVDLVGNGPGGAKELAAKLVQHHAPGKLLWLHAIGADLSPKAVLSSAGWAVETIPTHRKQPREQLPSSLQIALQRRQLNVAIWSAPSQVQLVRQISKIQDWQQIRHVAIGQQTATALEEGGFQTAAIAQRSDIHGVLEALETVTD